MATAFQSSATTATIAQRPLIIFPSLTRRQRAAASPSPSTSSPSSVRLGGGGGFGGGIFGARKPSSSSWTFVPCGLSPQQEEPYLKLGVAPGASPEAVKRAYKRMAKLFHPDVCDEPDAALRFNDVKAAYETIAAERGNLSNVGSEEWRGKWQQQLRQMRKVETGQATVNVRRRRVVRMTPSASASASASTSSSSSSSEEEEEEEEVNSDVEKMSTPSSSSSGCDGPNPANNTHADMMVDEEELTWQREQEMKWTVRSQLGALKDRTRRRRKVVPPQKNKFVEPFGDGISSKDPTAHDDEWNHTVQ